MASEEGLKILLKAEVQDFLKDMKSAKDAISNAASSTAEAVKSFLGFSSAAEGATTASEALTNSLNNESKAADRSGKSWNQLGKYIFEQTYQRNVMIQQVNQGVGSWKLEAKAVEGAGEAVGKTGAKNASTTRTLHDLSNVLIQSTTSGVGLERALIRTVEAFDFTQKSAGGFKEGLKALGGAILGPSGIILGISAIVTGATILIQKYGSLGNAVQALNPFLSEQAKVQAELNGELLKGANAVGGELAKLDLLYKSAKDLNVPLSERRRITDELIKQYPDTFNGLTAEAIATGKADTAYKSLTKTLLAQAAVKAGNELIAQQGKSLLELRLESEALQKELKDLQQNGTKSSFANPFGKDIVQNSKDIEAIQNRINANKAKQNELDRKAALIQQEQLKIVEQFGTKSLGLSGATDVTKIAAQLTNELGKIDEKTQLTGESAKRVAKDKLSLLTKAFEDIATIGGDKAKPILQDIGGQIAKLQPIADATVKKTRTISDVLKDLNAALAATDAQSKLFGGTADNLANEKITALNKAFDQLVKLGLKPASPELKKISDQINLLSASIIGVKPLDTILAQPLGKQVTFTNVKPLTADEYAKAVGLKNFKSELKLDPKIKLEPIFRQTPALENLTTFSKAFVDKMAKLSADAKAAFKKNYIVWGDALTSGVAPAIVNLGALLQSGISDTLANFGEGLGKAIASGDFANALNSIVNSMSAFIVSFGKQLIEAGTLALIAQKSLIANPYIAIAAGIGAIAIGTALKNSVPSFATGGVVNGPTLAMIGDNPSGVEYMIPKEVMDKVGGNSDPFIAETRVSGSDLLVLVKRAGLNQNRING